MCSNCIVYLLCVTMYLYIHIISLVLQCCTCTRKKNVSGLVLIDIVRSSPFPSVKEIGYLQLDFVELGYLLSVVHLVFTENRQKYQISSYIVSREQYYLIYCSISLIVELFTYIFMYFKLYTCYYSYFMTEVPLNNVS